MTRKTSEAKKKLSTRKSRLNWSNLPLRQDKFSAGRRVPGLWELLRANELRKIIIDQAHSNTSFKTLSLQQLDFPGFPKSEVVYWNLITLKGFLSVYLSKCFLNMTKLSVVTTSFIERFYNLIAGLACYMKNYVCMFAWTYFFHVLW